MDNSGCYSICHKFVKKFKNSTKPLSPISFLDFLGFLGLTGWPAYVVDFISFRLFNSTSESDSHVTRSSFSCSASYDLYSFDQVISSYRILKVGCSSSLVKGSAFNINQNMSYKYIQKNPNYLRVKRTIFEVIVIKE